MTSIKVKALRKGTHNGFRESGEVFEYTGPTTQKDKDGKEQPYFPSWMQKRDGGEAKAAEREEGSQIAGDAEALQAANRELAGAVGGEQDIDALRAEYEVVFNEKAHHMTKPETLRKKIDDRKAQLAE